MGRLLQIDILGSPGVQQSCSTALTSLRSVHVASVHGYARLIVTANLINSLSYQRTARGSPAPLVAKNMGPVESVSLTENGADMEDFDGDELSFNELSSRKKGFKFEQNGMSAHLMLIPGLVLDVLLDMLSSNLIVL